MAPRRRDLLSAGAAALATVGMAGCSGLRTNGDPRGGATTEGSSAATPTGADASANAAVAAEWSAYRARAWDALALGVAGDFDAGARVVEEAFARFEGATGEHGAHEALESTGEANYEGFEGALGALREGLVAGDRDRVREEALNAAAALAAAQESVVDDATADALDLQLFGVTARNAAVAATVGEPAAAGTLAAAVRERFESAGVHDRLESVEGDTYDRFEGALERIVAAADDGDREAIRTESQAAFAAALDGSYALAPTTAHAGTGHLAALQARGWDAAALAGAGGPSASYAHAAGLSIYRARAHDARWLAAAGEADRASTMVGDVFAHFEGARAHEALESAAGDAYEGFESELSALRSAIESGDADAADEALSTLDSNLAAGISALAGANAPLLEAAFFRARLADARERYRRGEHEVAASIAESVFARFEGNELDFHETMESTSEELYARFEEEHLAGLVDAFGAGDDDAVATHYDGVRSALLEFETTAGSTPTVSGAEAAYLAARGFDAAVLAALGDDARAQAIGQGAFRHFESGAGGYHEALEAADESRYESFESSLSALVDAAGDGRDVAAPAKRFGDEALGSAYAIVGSGAGGDGDAASEKDGESDGSHADAAREVVRGVFAHFEEARVHELLEEADRNAYETFEGRLDAYAAALEEDGNVGAAASSFADAAQYAQFAVVDAVEDLPLDLDLADSSAGDSESGEGGDSELAGGRNVVEGVPEDADHVVDLRAVAFEPAELTVSAGDTVAWAHRAGEAHTVTANGDELPEGAGYWASGGFESQSAAESGWDAGEGAVQSGQSFVHTFEATGTHEYVCIPHEAAGMTGTVVVE